MSDRLALKIKELSELDRAPLLNQWRAELKETAPSHLRRQLLLPLLLYKLQEKACGGLKPEVRQRLRKLAKNFDMGSGSINANLASPLKIKPGTRLSREWQSKTHHVLVSEQGFEYGGQTYQSLSHVARSITGTRWSRPLFFGLKKNGRKRGEA
jgi:Protein of unknown function (DUF2924)